MAVASSGATVSGTPEVKTVWAALMSVLMFHSGFGLRLAVVADADGAAHEDDAA